MDQTLRILQRAALNGGPHEMRAYISALERSQGITTCDKLITLHLLRDWSDPKEAYGIFTSLDNAIKGAVLRFQNEFGEDCPYVLGQQEIDEAPGTPHIEVSVSTTIEIDEDPDNQEHRVFIVNELPLDYVEVYNINWHTIRKPFIPLPRALPASP